MAKVAPVEFFRQVRQEIARSPGRRARRPSITTGMVFVMVLFCSLFFLVVDYILAQGVQFAARESEADT